VQPADLKAEEYVSASQLLSKPGVMELLVCAVTALAYIGTASFGFVYDDKPAIVDSPAIRSWHFLAESIPQILGGAPSSGGGTFYRPVTLAWMRLNYLLFGLWPAGWHLAMLALHVLMTYLVFVLVRKLTGKRATAALVALLFGLHPVHVENVAWLSSVNDLLVSVFLVGSFIAYLKFREGKNAWMALSLLLFALALLSKETAAAFPLLIAGFAIVGGVDGESGSREFRIKQVLACALYFVVLLVYLVTRQKTLHGFATSITPLSWSTMIFTTPSVLWFDLKHLLLPITSSEFYSLDYVTTPGFGNFVLPVILLVLAGIAVGYWIRRLANPRLGFLALLWIVVPILPTLYLRAIASDNFVHDRLLYLPSLGILILLTLAIEQITSGPLAAHGSIKAGVVAAVCAAGFVGILFHEVQWTNNILLYENGLKSAPKNLIVEDNLANEFTNIGRYDRAIPLYLDVLQRNPQFWSANYNLGYAYYRSGEFSEAEKYLNRAIQIDDHDADQFIFLARAQMEQGRLEEAGQNVERALQRGPQSPGFHFVLAKILEARGEREQAIAEYKSEMLNHPENTVAGVELQRLQLQSSR
jgi:protein O-mannosyl-transferase